MSKPGRNLLVCTVLIVLLLLSVITVSAGTPPAEVWVAPSGNDSNDGSEGSPFQTIQKGIDSVAGGGTVYVAAGTYNERLVIGNSLSIHGAQTGTDPTQEGARTETSGESIIDLTGLPLQNPNVLIDISAGVSGVTVAGFTLVGSPDFNYADEACVRACADDIDIRKNIITGYIGVLFKGPGENLNISNNRITANKSGIIIQPNPSEQVTISHNIITIGSNPAGDESGIYLTNTVGCTINQNTITGFTSRGVGGSDNQTLDITGNTFTGNRDNISLWGNTSFVTISDNDLLSATRYGINIKGQDITITGNTITNSADTGIFIDRHVIDTERIAINENSISGNTEFGISVTLDVTDTVDATANWWGDPSGPERSGNGNSQGEGDKISEGVAYDPWYIDAAMTQLSDEVSVTVKVYGNGTVTGQKDSYKIGEQVTLMAEPGENYNFVGWYRGANKLGTETSFELELTEDITIDAVFFWWPDFSRITDVSLTKNANAAFSFYDGNVVFNFNPATKDADGRLAVYLYGLDSERGVPSTLYSMGLFLHIQCTPNLEGIPVQLVVKYDPTKIPEDMDENSLKLYRYNETTKRWVPLTNQSVDTANKVIRAQLTGFSTYAVFAGELPPTGTLMIYLAAAGAALLLAGLLVSTKKKAAGV